MKRDLYRNFEELRRAERADIDYRIVEHRRISPVAVIAPHGGTIEPGTAELAEAIAGEDYSLYCFEGLKRSDSRDLHMTSTSFDEPRCVSLVAAADYVVALHGFGGAGNERLVYLGGLDRPLRDRIGRELKERGFSTTDSGRPHLGGLSLKNIVNKGRRRMGAQMEISRNLRDEMRRVRDDANGAFATFVAGVRHAIATSLGG